MILMFICNLTSLSIIFILLRRNSKLKKQLFKCEKDYSKLYYKDDWEGI